MAVAAVASALVGVVPTASVSAEDPPSAADAAADIGVRSGFTPLAPARLVDTRSGAETIDGLQAGSGRLSAGSSVDVIVAGRGGVPDQGARAAVLNVTVVSPSGPGYLTAHPTGSERPNASNVNFTSGSVVAGQVLARLGTGGMVTLYAHSATNLVVDVVGWIDAEAEGDVLVPARIVDSRSAGTTVDGNLVGFGAPDAGRSVAVDVLGRGGVPKDGVGSVIVSVVAVGQQSPGFLTVYPDGDELPNSSTLNYRAGQTVANQVLAKLGPSGRFRVFTSARAEVIVDVVGWLPEGSDLVALTPARLVDTRASGTTIDGQYEAQGRLQAGVPQEVLIGGRTGVPVNAGAVMLNVTAVNPDGPGYLTAYPGGEDLPNASSLNFAGGSVVANQVMVKLGRHDKIQLFSPVGTDIVVDLVGWMPPGLNQPLNNVVPLTEVVQSIDPLSGGPDTGSARFKVPAGVELLVDDITVFETPEGDPFYGEVTSVVNGIATATEVPLTRVIPTGSFDFIADANTGVIQESSFADQTAGDVVASYGVLDGISLSTKSWEATCEAGVEGDVDFDYYLDALSFGGGADWGLFYASAELYYQPKIGFEATAELNLAGTCTLGVPIASKDLPDIKFSIGAIPIVIKHEIGVALEVTIGVESAMTISAGATVTAKLGVGVSSSRGLYPIREFNLARHFSTSSESKAELTVGLPISYEAALYGMVGATLTVTPSVTATLEPGNDKWLVVTAQVDVGVDLWVKIEIRINFFLSSYTFELKKSVKLGEATIWGPKEIYSRTRSKNQVAMASTMPSRTAVNTSYSGNVSIPAPPGYSTTWTTPGLPDGLAFTGSSTGGTVGGKPKTAGVYSFGVNADLQSQFFADNSFYAQGTFTVDVAPQLKAGTQLAGVGEVGRPFVGVASGTGGVGPYTWSATGLPAGVALAATSTTTPLVKLTGTPTTASSGTARITLRDSVGSSAVTFDVPWNVAPALSISSSPFPVAGVGVPYQQSFTLVGGVEPISTSITGVPYGMAAVRSGRTITLSGTPQIAGAQNVRLAARSDLGGSASATRYFSVRPAVEFSSTVVNVPVDPNPMQLTDGWLKVVGGTGPYTWSVSGLPAGITFDTTQHGARARFVGALAVPTTVPVIVTVTDSSDDPDASGEITLRSNGSTTFLQSSLPGAAIAAVYDTPIAVTGGRAPYRWTARGHPPRVYVVAGATTDTISLTGTPTGPAGNYRIELIVGDDTARPAVSATYPITVAPEFALASGTLPNGAVGSTYSMAAELAVIGGVPPYTWTVTGLPAGITLDTNTIAATRTFEGVPTAVGTSDVSISVSDSSGSSAVAGTRSLVVAPALSLSLTGVPTTTSTDADYVGAATATGGNAPLTVTATGLPSGISMAANGAITGRATASGSFPVTVRSTDAAGYVEQASFTLRAIDPLALDLSLAPTGLVTGRNYTGSVAATGGVPPYSFAVANPSGSVPSFVNLVAATGTFTGATPATTAGTYDLEVTVTDSEARAVTQPLTITVAETPPLAIASTGLPTVATVGTAYSATPSASGGLSPYTWSLVSKPAWMSIDPSTGVISGTPDSGNGTVDVTIRADGGIFSGTRTYTLDVRPAITIDTSELSLTGTAGTEYTGAVTFAGGRNVAMVVTGLNADLTAATTDTTTTISGRPLGASTSTVTFTATDADGRSTVATATITIAAAPALTLETTTMPTSVSLLTPTATYEGTATVAGGVTPYSWEATGVPAGVTATPSGDTMTFSGRPAASGTFPIVLTVTDEAGSDVTETVTVSIVVETMTIDISDLWSFGHRGQTESLGFVRATGGTSPYAFSAVGLPAGLTIDPDTGEISGSATTVGSASVTLIVDDASSPTPVRRTATWNMSIREPLPITMPSLPTEFSTTVFVPVRLAGWTGGTPTFTTVARFSDGTSKTDLFTCSAYAATASGTTTEDYGCIYQYDPAVDDHSGFTLDIFATVGFTYHGAWRGTIELTKQKKTQVSMGIDYGCALYEDTTVKCWGSNEVGQLGNANASLTAAMHQPVPVTDAAGVTLTGFTEVVANANVASGKAFTCAVQDLPTRTGTVWCWGYGLDGQLGNNASVSSKTPVAVRQAYGNFTTISDPSKAGLLSPTQLSGASRLVLGGTQACLYNALGSEWSSTSLCWGTDWEGTLQEYADAPTDHGDTVADHDSVSAIGATHICFNEAEFGLCDGPYGLTGAANRGQNADGSYPHHFGVSRAGARVGTDPTGDSFASDPWFTTEEYGARHDVWDHTAGHSHTCFLDDENISDDEPGGAVRCFGDNDNLQIGSASILNKTFADWTKNVSFPSTPGIEVDPSRNVNNDYQTRFAYSGPVGRFTDIDAGGDVGCGLRTTSVVNTQPAVGVTSTTAGLVCWGKPYVDTAPRDAAVITTDVDWAQISVGPNAACALKASGALFCWGANNLGQLGLGSNVLASGNVFGQHRPYPSNA